MCGKHIWSVDMPIDKQKNLVPMQTFIASERTVATRSWVSVLQELCRYLDKVKPESVKQLRKGADSPLNEILSRGGFSDLGSILPYSFFDRRYSFTGSAHSVMEAIRELTEAFSIDSTELGVIVREKSEDPNDIMLSLALPYPTVLTEEQKDDPPTETKREGYAFTAEELSAIERILTTQRFAKGFDPDDLTNWMVFVSAYSAELGGRTPPADIDYAQALASIAEQRDGRLYVIAKPEPAKQLSPEALAEAGALLQSYPNGLLYRQPADRIAFARAWSKQTGLSIELLTGLDLVAVLKDVAELRENRLFAKETKQRLTEADLSEDQRILMEIMREKYPRGFINNSYGRADLRGAWAKRTDRPIKALPNIPITELLAPIYQVMGVWQEEPPKDADPLGCMVLNYLMRTSFPDGISPSDKKDRDRFVEAWSSYTGSDAASFPAGSIEDILGKACIRYLYRIYASSLYEADIAEELSRRGGMASTQPQPETHTAEIEVEQPKNDPVVTEVEQPENDPVVTEIEQPENDPVVTEVEQPENDPAVTEVEQPETDPAVTEVEQPETDPAVTEVEQPETDPVVTEVEQPETDPVVTEVEQPKTDELDRSAELCRKALEEIKYIRPGSVIDRKKLFQKCSSIAGESIPAPDEEHLMKLLGMLPVVATSSGFALYTQLIPEELLRRIDDDIAQKLKATPALYWKSVYDAFRKDLLGTSVSGWALLRDILRVSNSGRFLLRDDYVAADENAVPDPTGEIIQALRDSGSTLTLDDLCERLPLLPRENVLEALKRSPDIAEDYGRWFLTEVLYLPDEYIETVHGILETAIDEKGYCSRKALMESVRESLPELEENNAALALSDNAMGEQLIRRMGGEFAKWGALLYRSGEVFNKPIAFERRCRQASTLTLAELQEMEADLGGGIPWETVMRIMVRVDENTLINRNSVQFNVSAIDELLDAFCHGDAVPISEVDQFGLFPTMGYPWNRFVVESYLFSGSGRYRVEHLGFSATDVYGLMVRNGAEVEDYDSAAAAYLKDEKVEATADALLMRLIETKGIANYQTKHGMIIAKKVEKLRDE